MVKIKPKIKILKVNNFNNDKSILPNFNNDIKYRNLKSFIDKINILSLENQNYNYNYDKKILTLSKNRSILGNKRIFSPISSSFKSIEQISTLRKIKKNKNHSMNSLNNKKTKKFATNLKYKNKNYFLLFAKARPYRYMRYKETNIFEKDNN